MRLGFKTDRFAMQQTLTPPSDQELEWFREDLGSWFQNNRRKLPWRRKSTTLYQHVVTEILLQRTRAEKVADLYEEFFSTFSNWNDIASASISEIENALKPVGIWRRRARALHDLAEVIVGRNSRFPENRAELCELPAVGQYVANSILLFKCVSREPLLDAGMARVIERYFGRRELADIRYDPKLQETAKRLVDCVDALELNWAVLDLAALICRPSKPRCLDCPLHERCRYAKLRQNADHAI